MISSVVDSSPKRATCDRVRQSCGVVLRRLYLERIIILVVQRGVKTIKIGEETIKAAAGHVVVTSGGYFADVTNAPDGDGVYEACVVTWSADIPPIEAGVGAALHGSFPAGSDFAASLDAARTAIADPSLPPAILTHRLQELLLWAREANICPMPGQAGALSIRMREIIAADPARDWR